MKKFFPVFLTVLVFSAPAWPQEVFDALRKRDIQAVKALIEKSPSVLDSRDGDGMTPLHYAAIGGDAAFIHYLVDKGANLELRDSRAQTPLHMAAMNDRKEAAEALIKRGADLEKRDDYARTAFILCARERGQAATARILLDAGAEIDAADKFGSTALGLAAWRGKREFVDLLLERGAAVPESGDEWRRLLSLSASQGLAGLFRRLTDKGQYLKAIEVSGETILHAAVQGGASEIVDALLERGFDPGRKDIYGWTPLHYAALDGRTEAARKLVEHGAPLDSPTIAGQTPYNVARERGMEAVAELLAENGAGKGDAGFPVLAGDYLGQKPPSGEAERFALGIVSSIWGLHSTAVFSPDGKEVYWAPMMTFPGEIYSRGGLLMMKRVDGRWTAPAWASFSRPEFDDDVPFFSADGKRIFFISSRPLPDTSEDEKERIWFADRTPAGWSEPRPIDAAVNDQDMHWQFSLDRQGNLYLASQIPAGLGMSDIYCARSVGGKYEKPVNLGDPINSADGENAPFIAPDGSYLLFSRQYDLWVSFRGAGNAWSEPVKLGPEVNSPSIELCPVVTADGKYLFFLSQRDGESHAYWVRADVIEKARPKSGQGVPAEQKEFPSLKGPYLGQKPPGMTPERFAPGIVTTPANEFGCCFSQDGREFYFTRYDPKLRQSTAIYVIRYDGVRWSEPVIAPFSGRFYDAEPSMAPDGSRLFFISTRPSYDMQKVRIWSVVRTPKGWGTPEVIGLPLSEKSKMGPSVAANGNLYYAEVETDDRTQIYMARFNRSGYDEPLRLGPGVNLYDNNSHPYVAPDESCLIYDAQPGSPASYDSYLFVSFKEEDGTWSKGRRLPEGVNAGNDLICASVTPDGKYMLWSRGMDIYWVDAKVIDDLGRRASARNGS